MEIEKIGILKTPETPIRDHLYTRVWENVTIYYKAVENTIKAKNYCEFHTFCTNFVIKSRKNAIFIRVFFDYSKEDENYLKKHDSQKFFTVTIDKSKILCYIMVTVKNI